MADEVQQEYTVEVAASAQDCFDAAIDFAAYPSWASNITKARVLEYNDAGLPLRVEMELDARIKTIRYVLEYRYRKPRELTEQGTECTLVRMSAGGLRRRAWSHFAESLQDQSWVHVTPGVSVCVSVRALES